MLARQRITEIHNANRTEVGLVTGFVHPKGGHRRPTPTGRIRTKTRPRPLRGPSKAGAEGGKWAKRSLEHIEGHGSTQVGQQAKPYKRKAVGLGSTSHQN